VSVDRKFRIAVIPGDGIGNEVVPEGLRVLDRLAATSGGTLACDRCDAPIALAAEPISLAHTLSCPFCQRRAPARDFLSLAPPTRPAPII